MPDSRQDSPAKEREDVSSMHPEDILKNAESVFDTSAKDNDFGYKEGAPNAVRLQLVEEIVACLPPGRALDAGCGTGRLIALLADRGFDCVGTDLSGEMLQQTRQRLGRRAQDIPLYKTPLNNLEMLPDRSFDAVFCLGVLPYVPETLEEASLRELRRVIRPGGVFITAQQNELFDLFTFNRYTLRFFGKYFAPLLVQPPDGPAIREYLDAVAKLMTHPTEPDDSTRPDSLRAKIQTRPENPLTYPEKLQRYGFANRDILYYTFHAVPPLASPRLPGTEESSRRLEFSHARDWRGMFLASMFISVAVAEAGDNV